MKQLHLLPIKSGTYSAPTGFLDLMCNGVFEPVEILGTFELKPLEDHY